jgi:hypothetical protein
VINATLLIALTITRHVMPTTEGLQVGLVFEVPAEVNRVSIECLPSPCPYGFGYALDTANGNILRLAPAVVDPLHPVPNIWFVGLHPQVEGTPLYRACVATCPPDPQPCDGVLCGPWSRETLACFASVPDGGCETTIYSDDTP